MTATSGASSQPRSQRHRHVTRSMYSRHRQQQQQRHPPPKTHTHTHTHAGLTPHTLRSPLLLAASIAFTLHVNKHTRTLPLTGSCSGRMGPKWSLGTLTMMRPLAALARPLRTARSVVNASAGRDSSASGDRSRGQGVAGGAVSERSAAWGCPCRRGARTCCRPALRSWRRRTRHTARRCSVRLCRHAAQHV